MRYISLFSGVEAASVAWAPLGWEPLAFCEVDEFPSAVLATRFPDVPNLGDVTKVDWEDFYGRYGAADVLVGGSPCQSFSIAGNREGLKGESGLMFEYIRAIRDLLRVSGNTCPRYILWENVPGALSSERGNAFGQLLAELDELGYGLAWRVLDAQFARVPGGARDGFFGPVAQRRRRVFLVGVLGSPHAAEILFERSCLSGDHPKGREAREALAEHLEGCSGMGYSAGFKYHQGSGAGSIGFESEQSPTIMADYHNQAVLSFVGEDGDTVGALAAQPGMKQQSYVCMSSGQANAEVREDGGAPSLTCLHEPPIVAMADDNGRAAVDENMCGSLKVGGGCAAPSNGEEVIGALCARDFKGVGSQYVSEGKVICERRTC